MALMNLNKKRRLPAFSVLMSVYHKESPEFLRQSLNSIVNQTLMPDEIVIIKDGPLTGKLDDVINDFFIRYPHIFKIVSLKENKGLGTALRIGLLNCSHDIVIRMDSDDISIPIRFEKLINAMNENSDMAVIGSYTGEFSKNPNKIDTIRKVPLNYDEIRKIAKYRNPFSHVTVAFRRDSVLNAGNYRPFLYHEDYYLWIRMLLKNYRMMNLPEILVLVRTDENKYRRRGGLNYVRYAISFQRKLMELGIITGFEFICNVVARTIVALLPNFIRRIIYVKLLRR